MAESWEESGHKLRFTPEALRDLLIALRAQNHTMIQQVEEVNKRLDRVVVATEKTAARAFWIALPIYLGIAVGVFSIVVVILRLMAQP
jgi:hypothetical protein